eukprot:764096-Hanusia_phi.AAC.2
MARPSSANKTSVPAKKVVGVVDTFRQSKPGRRTSSLDMTPTKPSLENFQSPKDEEHAHQNSVADMKRRCAPMGKNDSEWVRSEHPGLLTMHDGTKRWYHCERCSYFNNRLYHSKMHYLRIHVKNGKSVIRKRKYHNESDMAPNVPILSHQSLEMPPRMDRPPMHPPSFAIPKQSDMVTAALGSAKNTMLPSKPVPKYNGGFGGPLVMFSELHSRNSGSDYSSSQEGSEPKKRRKSNFKKVVTRKRLDFECKEGAPWSPDTAKILTFCDASIGSGIPESKPLCLDLDVCNMSALNSMSCKPSMDPWPLVAVKSEVNVKSEEGSQTVQKELSGIEVKKERGMGDDLSEPRDDGSIPMQLLTPQSSPSRPTSIIKSPILLSPQHFLLYGEGTGLEGYTSVTPDRLKTPTRIPADDSVRHLCTSLSSGDRMRTRGYTPMKANHPPLDGDSAILDQLICHEIMDETHNDFSHDLENFDWGENQMNSCLSQDGES